MIRLTAIIIATATVSLAAGAQYCPGDPDALGSAHRKGRQRHRPSARHQGADRPHAADAAARAQTGGYRVVHVVPAHAWHVVN